MNLEGDITSLFTKPKLSPGETLPADNPAPAGTTDRALQNTDIDHPITQIADLIIHVAVPICEHNGIAPPAQDTYDSFARDVINQAAWEFAPDLPDGDGKLPRWLIAALAIVGIALVFLPTAASLIQKQNAKEEAEQISAAENEPQTQPEQTQAQPEPEETPLPTTEYLPTETGTAIIGL